MHTRLDAIFKKALPFFFFPPPLLIPSTGVILLPYFSQQDHTAGSVMKGKSIPMCQMKTDTASSDTIPLRSGNQYFKFWVFLTANFASTEKTWPR